jgi:hypothetical protein
MSKPNQGQRVMNLKICLSLLIVLAGCQSVPNPTRSLTVEQCSINLVTRTVLVVDPETNETSNQEIIDADKSECFCRPYKFSLEFMGPVGGSKPKRAVYCNKVIGSLPGEYLKQVNFLGDVRKDIQSSIP